jgi:hypothetical protein
MDSSVEGTDRKVGIVLNGDELRTTGPEKTTNVYRRVPALPQGTPFRQGLLGASELTSYSPNSAVSQELGTKPIGYLMLGGSGRYIVIGKNPNRPKSDKPSADGFVANFGTCR